MLSPRGSMAVDERTNILIARDIAGNLDHIEELVRSLDTQTAQVLVEARIVEATSSYSRDIGIQWGGDAAASSATGNATGLAFPSSVTLAGGATDPNAPKAGLSPVSSTAPANPNFAVNLPAAVGTGAGWRARPEPRLDRQQLQPRRSPLRRGRARAWCASSRARASSP